MAKETKEERAARLLVEAAEAAERKKVFQATLPARMIAMQALANQIGNISTEVTLLPSGPCLKIFLHNESYLDASVHYDTEEWEVEHVERMLREKKEEVDARMARYKLAQAKWDTLSADEKAAIKEHFHSLRN